MSKSKVINEIKTILSYEKTISEQLKSIVYAIKRNKRILLEALMKAGKTHLVINELSKELNKEKIRIILISPVTLLIEQQGERAKLAGLDNWTMYYSKHKGLLTTTNIITTPNSLPKVVEALKEQNDKFVLIVDEAHERLTSYNYRKEFNNIEEAEKEENCISCIDMTATPQGLLRSWSDNYDKYLKLQQLKEIEGQKNPYIFKHGQNFTIKPIDNMNRENIFCLLDEVSSKYEHIAIKLDDIKMLDDIQIFFKNKGKKFEYLASKPLKDDIEEINKAKIEEQKMLREAIKNYKDYGEDTITGFTSLINSGVELNNNKNTVFINFTNDTYNFVNEIQSIGRFRNGLKEFMLVVKKQGQEEQQESPASEQNILTYEEIYKDILSQYEEGKNQLQKSLNAKIKIINTKMFINTYHKNLIVDDNNIVSIDIKGVQAIANNEYYKQFLKYPKELLKQFEEGSGLLFDTFKIDGKEIEKTQENKKIINSIKEANKLQKELETKEIDDIKQELKTLKDDSYIRILDRLPNTRQEEELIERIDRIKSRNKNINKEITILSEFTNNVEGLKLWSSKDNKQIKNIILEGSIVMYNNIYLNDRESLVSLSKKGLKTERTKIKKQLLFLDYIKENLKSRDRITNKHIKELIELTINNKLIEAKKYNLASTEEEQKKALVKLTRDTKGYLLLLVKTVVQDINGTNYFRYTNIKTDINNILLGQTDNI